MCVLLCVQRELSVPLHLRQMHSRGWWAGHDIRRGIWWRWQWLYGFCGIVILILCQSHPYVCGCWKHCMRARVFYYFHHVLKKLSFVRWLKLFRIAVSLVTFVWWLTYLADVYMASVSFRFSGRKACLAKNVGFCNRGYVVQFPQGLFVNVVSFSTNVSDCPLCLTGASILRGTRRNASWKFFWGDRA